MFFRAVAWIGFPPQSNVIFGAVVLALFLVGLRLEAVMTLFAAVGSAGLWFLLAPIVDRPRPSPEMVRVAMELPTGGFPSGHVLNLTAIFGFLIYLDDRPGRATSAGVRSSSPCWPSRSSPSASRGSTTARTGRATSWAAT